MCGIAGIVSFHPSQPVNDDLLRSMVKTIHHRGPDDSGVFVNSQKTVGLGSTRLAILDLSPRGHMPMSNADQTLWITFNGEIYNFQEEREKLKAKGYAFRSVSDTEVILALYEEYGTDCVKHLRGMFAFAIWDSRRERLFCARDRVGKKPFKYFFDGERFVFASELKSILADHTIPRLADPNALNHYLSFQYVPTPLTGFRGIRKLPAGHTLSFEKGKLEIRSYWDLNYRQKLNLSESEWVDRLKNELTECVRLRLISDVPLGAFLSGGLDSSMIVALMSRLSDQPVKTFSIGFKEKKFNELEYARKVAQLYSTDHHEFIVEPESVGLLDKLVYAYEEPYADSSAIPTYYVSKLAHEFVTVALNGDGGDENFSGYDWYPIHRFALHYQKIPAIVRGGVIAPMASLGASLFPTTFFERSARFAQSARGGVHRQSFHYLAYFTEEQKAELFTDAFKELLRGPSSTDLVEHRFKVALAEHEMDKIWHVDFKNYLTDDLLVKVDIASMMNSMEGRSPLLDHHFLELTAQIPPRLKLKGFQKKYIFKKLAERLLPRDVVYRKKQGFRVPLEHWFKNELKDFTEETLLNGELVERGIVHRTAVESLIKTHQTTRVDYSRHIWALLTLDRWFTLFNIQR